MATSKSESDSQDLFIQNRRHQRQKSIATLKCQFWQVPGMQSIVRTRNSWKWAHTGALKTWWAYLRNLLVFHYVRKRITLAIHQYPVIIQFWIPYSTACCPYVLCWIPDKFLKISVIYRLENNYTDDLLIIWKHIRKNQAP